MILTSQEKEMFVRLSESTLGRELASYLSRLQGDVCDSRNWADGEDKTHANKTAKVIGDDILGHIIIKKQSATPPPYPYI